MIVEADLNSAELRVLALVTHDQPFLAVLAAGAAPHKITAKQLFGRNVGKDEEEYTFAKSFTYRWFYSHPDKPPSMDGGALRTYRVVISGETLAYATRVMNEAHPAIVVWKRRQLADLQAHGLIRNPFGRYRDLSWAARAYDPEVRKHAEGAALNFPIQTAIGDVMNRATIRAYNALAGWRAGDPLKRRALLIFQCHDSLGVECAEWETHDVCAILKEAIEQPIEELEGAIIPAELKVGPTWGEVKPV